MYDEFELPPDLGHDLTEEEWNATVRLDQIRGIRYTRKFGAWPDRVLLWFKKRKWKTTDSELYRVATEPFDTIS